MPARPCATRERTPQVPDHSSAAPPRIAVSLTVNGQHHALQVEPWTSLLDLLRHELALTGSKKGCDLSLIHI